MSNNSIILLGKGKPEDSLKNALRKLFPISTLNFAEMIKSFRLTSDFIRFIFIECDYVCTLDKCLSNFALLTRHPDIPFGILRSALLNANLPKSYYLSILLKDDCLSSTQKDIVETIKNSEIYAFSPLRHIHPSNAVHKIIKVQMEIAEKYSKRIGILELAKSVGRSPSWLSSRFKEISTVGLNDFVLKNIFCHSLWQLASTEKSIKCIALEHNFQPNSFSRRFMKIFTKPPNIIRSYYLNIQNKALSTIIR